MRLVLYRILNMVRLEGCGGGRSYSEFQDYDVNCISPDFPPLSNAGVAAFGAGGMLFSVINFQGEGVWWEICA